MNTPQESVLIVEDDARAARGADRHAACRRHHGARGRRCARGAEAARHRRDRPRHLRRADARRERLRAALGHQAAAGGPAGGADDGLRHDRAGGLGHARGRDRLHRQALRCAGAHRHGAPSARGADRAGRSRRRGSGVQAHAGARAQDRRERRHGADHRRERHGQGSVRALHPRPLLARRQAVRRHQLRGDSRQHARGDAVRLREGRLHRRARGARRQVRAGAGRHAPARRDLGNGSWDCRRRSCASCRSARSSGSAATAP